MQGFIALLISITLFAGSFWAVAAGAANQPAAYTIAYEHQDKA